jgi:DNA-binding GntR family transcriptional regulator
VLDQLQTAPALIDQVHDQLVTAIASGDLAPGQRLTQESVAAMLGVSRQPVSHALQILKRRGLLIEHGKRGLAVAPLQRDRIMNLYQIREILDGLAARLAAERCRDHIATTAEIDILRRALAAGTELSQDADTKQLVAADVTFHSVLYELSGNPEISSTVAEQWPQFMRSMGFILASGGNPHDRRQSIWAEHDAIADAIFAGNPEKAEQLARSHARNAAEQTADQLPDIKAAQ